MFLSYIATELLLVPPFKGTYTITDSDFVVEHHSFSVWESIIEVYEQRNLPVASNLMRFYFFLCKKNDRNYTASQFLHYCEVYGKDKFTKYKEDLSKYLMLI